ncbi:MAG: nuclear transport factor 2 family protein [Bacteroidota bacterium]
MRSVLLAFALLLITPPGAQAQSTEASAPEAAVRATIDLLFDAMRAGDSTQVRQAFHPEGLMRTAALGEDGVPVLSEMPVGAFAQAVGQPRDDRWDERLFDVEIRVDGPLATAWTPYAFYRGDQFSHCGVNAFQLIDTPAGWRITSIMDTRQREGCEIPEEVQRGG